MSEPLNYPTDPTGTPSSVEASLRGVLVLLRRVFFPRVGTGLVERVAALEDAGLIGEAPLDGRQYIRRDGRWIAVSVTEL